MFGTNHKNSKFPPSTITVQQSELSTLEMKLNTINLLQKFIKYQPSVVCFVGKKIWDVFESVVGKTAEFDETVKQKVKLEGEVENGEGSGDGGKGRSVVTLDPTPERGTVKIEPAELGDQPSLLPLSASPSKTPQLTPAQTASLSPAKARAKKGAIKPPKTPFSFSQPRALRIPHPPEENGGEIKYTYFFVVPSTSGLERTPVSHGQSPKGVVIRSIDRCESFRNKWPILQPSRHWWMS